MRQRTNSHSHSQRWTMAGLAALAFLFLAPPLQAATTQPFKSLLGSWKGGGTFSLQDGTKERISCNAYYTGGGSQLGIAIQCKSANNEIHMRGKISHSGGRVSGSWEERTYNAEGKLSGKASKRDIKMDISGNVTGTMLVSFSSRKQSVSIKMTGTALETVRINLAK